jgi:hypothetical protein
MLRFLHCARNIASSCLLLLFILISMCMACPSMGQDPYLIETFDNNDKGWPFIGAGDGYNISIEKGHLVMDGNRTAIHTYIKAGLTEESNVAIYARLIFLTGDHLGWMGIRFGMSEQADKYCSFVLNNDKGFLIGVSNGKKYETVRQGKSLLVKPYDYNTLTVIKNGLNYKFLINDKQVHEAKIKDFFGPMVGLITNMNMKMQVDELEMYDPKNGRTIISSNSELSSVQLSTQGDASLESMLISKDAAPPDFKEFLGNFPQLPSPYYFSPETGQGTDVSHLSFTQKNFYKYVAANVRNKTMYALGKLSECGQGYALLMMNRYFINNQDVSRFIVVAFNSKGEITGEKEVGAMVKESGDIFNVIDFKAYRDGSVVNIEATLTYHNGNKQKSSVRFNTSLCNF